jgi:hypothetical protein
VIKTLRASYPVKARSLKLPAETPNVLFERLRVHFAGNLYGEEKPMPSNHRLGVADGKNTQLLVRAPSCLKVLRSGEQAEAVFRGQGQFCTSVELEKT